ncbi:MAG: hypothetical protein HOE92_00775 [Euryarchaeota archaeon]|jgi:hypothetical protein|nr:hypothetical protein [Euryarchaeota archaeon]MBT3970731.1 hypothetical protein [Euryarchaeota archaeon]MBT6644538.1 hypothetical protein [Euryarchaeota archaeon]
MHGLEEEAKHTTPFHTFDPCDGDNLARVVESLEAARKGDNTPLALFCQETAISNLLAIEEIQSVNTRSDILWDDATTAWMLSLPTSNGKMALPEPLDYGMHRQRLGRFPHGNGSPMKYILDNIIDDNSDERLMQLLHYLHDRLGESNVGHSGYAIGNGGLSLKGYLIHEEVQELRGLLQRGKWKVSSDEPLDGGVRDIAKHLTIILRNAISRKVGILHRSHT